jgi:hypothetical protein
MLRDKTLKQSIKDFLTNESLKAPEIQHCPTCGTRMYYLTATFTFGDNESWDIPLPFCAVCEKDCLIAS